MHISGRPLKGNPSELLSKGERDYMERYTKRIRKAPHSSKETSHCVRRWFEGINRKLAYRLFRRFFHNDDLTTLLDPSQVRSIFVIPFGAAIGDMVVALPLFHAIKQHLPHCKVGTFVTERNHSLVRSDPNVDEVFSVRDKRSFRNFREIRRARRSGYDVVINMHIHGMTKYGLIANAISPRGTKVSWGHARGKLYRTLYNELLPYDRDSMHAAQMGLLMLESVIALDRPLEQRESRPTIIVRDTTRALVEERIRATLDQLGASWYVHLNIQARNPRMEWGIENIVALARRFLTQYPDGAIFFSASPIMRDIVQQQISTQSLHRIAFFPTSFDLQELAVLVQNSRLVITPDTAVTHFASASSRPVLVLHPGLIGLPLEWIPLQVPSYILAPPSRSMAAADILPEDAWQAVKSLLSGERKATATSLGLKPEADPLFQASNASEPLASLILRSSVPQIIREFTPTLLADAALRTT